MWHEATSPKMAPPALNGSRSRSLEAQGLVLSMRSKKRDPPGETGKSNGCGCDILLGREGYARLMWDEEPMIASGQRWRRDVGRSCIKRRLVGGACSSEASDFLQREHMGFAGCAAAWETLVGTMPPADEAPPAEEAPPTDDAATDAATDIAATARLDGFEPPRRPGDERLVALRGEWRSRYSTYYYQRRDARARPRGA